MKTYDNALHMISDNFGIIGPERHEIARIIIENYQYSQEPFDILGVAYAYLWQGAKFRKVTINFFEEYLSFHIENKITYPCISEWSIYSNLATLYEKEYEYEKAIECLKQCIKIDQNSNAADYTRIGDILIKIDINKAEDYYLELLNNNRLKDYKRQFAYALDDVLEKKKQGYVYKPRGKIKKIPVGTANTDEDRTILGDNL